MIQDHRYISDLVLEHQTHEPAAESALYVDFIFNININVNAQCSLNIDIAVKTELFMPILRSR